MNPSASDYALPAAQATPQDRADFIRRTYLHLAGAILAFAVLEYYLIHSPLAGAMLDFIGSTHYGWLMILGGFIVTGWLARGLAHSASSPGLQYLGLALYVLFEAIIFVPILFIAAFMSDPMVLPTAAVMTGVLFGGLTFTAVTTRKDFSFLGGILSLGGFGALGLIICASLFGLQLGTWFSVGMIVLAGGAILYDTSKILRVYPTDRHVAASLELFASVALMFWYVLRLLMRARR